MVKNNYEMIPGSGVNLEQFAVSEFPSDKEINFIFIGRVMKIKGIDLYLECAKAIKQMYPNTKFYIAGFIEEEGYKDIIDDFHSRKIVEYLGFQKDIKSWITKCHCTILPSYGGEGVPNVLLESAASGRICIASKINGSIDVIDDEMTGYLFENGVSKDLVNKVEKFIRLDKETKKQMGLAGRRKVEREFDRQIVIDAYLRELHGRK